MNALRIAAACGLLALLAPVAPAHAGEGAASCKNFIDALPAVIGSAGTWCLRKDLEYDFGGNYGIRIDAPNVTIDCNGFGMRNVYAPVGFAYAVLATGRDGLTVRNCRITDFEGGVGFDGGLGHLVEDNHILGSKYGILLNGDYGLVRRNRVVDTFGDGTSPAAIEVAGDAIDNVVDRVDSTAEAKDPHGVYVTSPGGVARGNLVRGVVGGTAILVADAASASDNHIVGDGANEVGIFGYGVSYCARNTVHGYDTPVSCEHDGGNLDN